jgi:hypothetical protein
MATTASDQQLSLEDRVAIEQQLIRLSYAFAHHIDHGEFEDMIQLFTEDGVFDRAGPVHRGHGELREAMVNRHNATTRHLMTNFHFTSVGPDEAEGVVYSITYHAHEAFDGTKPLVYGTTNGRLLELHDRYRRTDDGWRFAERIAVPVFVPEVWP